MTGGLVLAALAAAGSLATADDPSYQPATASPTAATLPLPVQGPAFAPAPQGVVSPAAASETPSPYPTAERWVRRTQRLREASTHDAVPKPNDAYLPPLPPLEPASGPQLTGQAYSVPVQTSIQTTGQAPTVAGPDAMAQRPSSPAQMPGERSSAPIRKRVPNTALRRPRKKSKSRASCPR